MKRNLVAACLLVWTASTVAAPECYPAGDFLEHLKSLNYRQHLMTAAISIDGRGEKLVDIGGDKVTLRRSLELQMKTASSAEEYADTAIQDGRIKPSEKQEFVTTARRLAYLKLKENSAALLAVLVWVRDDGKGVVFQREITFRNEAKQGEGFAPADSQICVQTRLRNIVIEPKEPTTAARLLKRTETPNCAEFPHFSGRCSGLSVQLANIAKDKELITLTANQADQDGKANSVVYLVSISRRGGRTISSSSEGTAIVTNFFFGL